MEYFLQNDPSNKASVLYNIVEIVCGLINKDINQTCHASLQCEPRRVIFFMQNHLLQMSLLFNNSIFRRNFIIYRNKFDHQFTI